MRRKRRIELHIEHREISVFAGARQSPQPPLDAPQSGAAGLVHTRPAACPTCGSPELDLLIDAVSSSLLDIATLNQGMQDGRVHLHPSPTGEWWICTKSLTQI